MTAKDEIFVLIAVWGGDGLLAGNERRYGVAKFQRCVDDRTVFEFADSSRDRYWKNVRSGDVELWSGSVEELMPRFSSVGDLLMRLEVAE